jgi:OTU domain-containing protein 6
VVWGGDNEINALAAVLRRSIIVYQATAADHTVGKQLAKGGAPLHISFHQHYITLGNHYNSVIDIASPDGDDE